MNPGGYGEGGEYYSPYGGGYGENANQQQQYNNDGAYDGSNQYYEGGQQYQQEEWSQQQQQYGDQNYGEYDQYAAPGADVNTSQFFQSRSPFVMHPNGTTDNYGNYDTKGDPISAIAVDDGEPDLLFVASHTSKHGGGGGRGNSRGGRGAMGARSAQMHKDPSLNRGSRLTVLYDDEHANDETGGGGFYGNRSIYSSFVAHPEAEGRVLDQLHSVMFAGGTSIATGSAALNTTIKARPTHAYGPPFGPPSFTHNKMHTPTPHFHTQQQKTDRPEENHCLGVSSIFPVSTPYLGSGGRVCSISPYGVRVHTRGGMIMSSRSDVLTGMTCGELLQRDAANSGGRCLMTVAGMSLPKTEDRKWNQHVHCVDLGRDLKVISSHTLTRDSSSRSGGEEGLLCVTDVATNYERNNIVVGCTDGTIRLLDAGRRNAEIAKAKAQMGGVAKVAVSDNLICASGYSSTGSSSPSSPLPYPFPAPHLLIYDVRMLGRGGITHMFSGNRGGPRFVNFLDGGQAGGHNNLLVGSGQTFGSFEIITPFSDTGPVAYLRTELIANESMTTVDVHEGELFIGTSHGRVLQYGLGSYAAKTMHSTKPVKEQLDMPSFTPLPPALSIDPTILLSSSSPSSSNDRPIQGWNVFDAYTMASNPILSSNNALFQQRYSRSEVKGATLGPLSKVMVPPSKRWLSNKLHSKLEEEENRGDSSGHLKVFPTTSLELEDLTRSSGSGKSVPNPNKLLCSRKHFAAAYDATVDPRKDQEDSAQRPSDEAYEESLIENEERGIPFRYRLTLHQGVHFDYAQYNNTGLYVGWDYSPSLTNSFACSVLGLLYFIDEIRDAALRLQLRGREMGVMVGKVAGSKTGDGVQLVSVTAELGLLFNMIESLSANGMIQPADNKMQGKRGQVKAFVPSNFLSAFALLPEATNLALIDGVAGAAEIARRPEAFYRFL